MRRTPLSLVSVLATAAIAASVLASGPAQAAPLPAERLQGTVVQPTLFGMHVFDVQTGTWPTIPIGSLRLWDNTTTWGQIEKKNDVFDWTALDTAVATAQKNGVNDILMVLAGTPSWATDDPASGGAAGVLPGAAGMPKNLADWDDWVRQVATRYKGKITSYQPWNEANLTTFSTGTPAEMADLTKHAYDIIKSVDPAALVVAPSTGTRLGGPFKKFYPAFLAELKARNWPVDVWAAHTYPASLGTPADRALLARTWITMLNAAGAPNRPLWDTENNFGLAGPGTANPDQDIIGPRAGEWAARSYLDALRLGISRVYWYAWAPDADLLGIQMNNGSTAAIALTTLQQWIVGATFDGCRGSAKIVCTFTRGGVTTRVVWSETGRASFRVPARFTQICRLDGRCVDRGPRKNVRVNGPILLTP
ncbi:MAG: hypothetical protein IPO93_06210 [Actinobacteria bacterium]|nr:hypothetical protein [Actinomycetota bacterium]